LEIRAWRPSKEREKRAGILVIEETRIERKRKVKMLRKV
jgi:hypothetical protein